MLTKETEYEDVDTFKLIVSYGFNKIGEQEPYFSITADQRVLSHRTKKWLEYSGGCLHDTIEEKLPELQPLIKWHLCGKESGPMHYIANGLFWWERSKLDHCVQAYSGDTTAFGEQAWEYFKSTIVFGAIEEDFPQDQTKESIQLYLENRLPKLMEKFHEDMKTFGIEIIEY